MFKKNRLISLMILMTISCSWIIPSALAKTARIVKEAGQETFLAGKIEGLSVDPEGVIHPGIQLEKLFEMPEDSGVLSLVGGRDGAIYAGVGNEGRIYRISHGGKGRLFCQLPDPLILCLAMDKKGNLYAGAGPGGRIYKIDESGSTQVLLETGRNFVWSLVLTDENEIMAACGDPALVLRCTPKGEITEQIELKSGHARCMTRTADGIWIGTSDPASVYCLTGKDLRLAYEGKETEISCIHSDSSGCVWFGAVSTSFVSQKDVTPSMAVDQRSKSESGDKSVIYRIDRQGTVESFWTTRATPVFAIAAIGDHPIVSCGGEGFIFEIVSQGKAALLGVCSGKAALAALSDHNNLYLGTSSPTAILHLDFDSKSAGSIQSKVYDTQTVAGWGNFFIKSKNADWRQLKIQTRSGNKEEPDIYWSDWSEIKIEEDVGKITSPASRYFQWKIEMMQGISPDAFIQEIEFSYLSPNRSPRISEVTVYPVTRGAFADQPGGMGKIFRQEFSDGTKAEYMIRLSAPEDSLSKKMWFRLRGMRTVYWDAFDPENDALIYKIEISPENENLYTVLEDDFRNPIYSFDSTAFPDGSYVMKITASDIGSNPKGSESFISKMSQPFVIDNSPPVLHGLKARRFVDMNKVNVIISGEVMDKLSRITQMEYSFNAETWYSFTCEDGILDERRESFSCQFEAPDGLLRTLIRITDENENVITAAGDIVEATAADVRTKGANQ